MHVPAPVARTDPPSMTQGPSAVKLTGRPEAASAASGCGPAPKTMSGTVASSMRWRALAISSSVVTSAAGAQSTSPAWEAVIVHVPAPVARTDPPSMTQGPSAVKLTGRPEAASAASGCGPAPKTMSGTVASSMRWRALAISSSVVTSAAGAQSTSPAWEAVIVHVPAPVARTDPPSMTQGPSAVKLTGRPEAASAASGCGPAPKTMSGTVASSMRWRGKTSSLKRPSVSSAPSTTPTCIAYV